MNTNHGQDPTSKKATSIEACCLYVAQKLNGRDYSTWKNADYINLSAQIRRNTKVHISENTLKRFFGKLKTPADYQPQKATRDALAVYIGFSDWEDFESFTQTERLTLFSTNPKKAIDKNNFEPDQKKGRKLNIKWLTAAITITLPLIISISYFQLLFEPTEKVFLYYQEAKAYSPHSAIFKIRSTDGSTVNLNEYHIEFKDWRNPKVSWNDSTLSYYYEKPGVYYPVLYRNNKAIDTATVTLLSRGWDITVQMQNDTVRLYPILQADSPQISPPTVNIKDLYYAGVDTLKSFFVNYAFVKPSTLVADNISIEADVQASKNRPGIRCSQVDLTVYGTKSSHYFTLMKPECTAWSYFKFGENLKSGKNEDLSNLGHDLSKGGKIRLEIHKQMVTIWLNQKQIFKTSYKRPIGEFKGVNFMFGGLGKVENVIIKGIK